MINRILDVNNYRELEQYFRVFAKELKNYFNSVELEKRFLVLADCSRGLKVKQIAVRNITGYLIEDLEQCCEILDIFGEVLLDYDIYLWYSDNGDILVINDDLFEIYMNQH